jgi:hypothetical protein
LELKRLAPLEPIALVVVQLTVRSARSEDIVLIPRPLWHALLGNFDLITLFEPVTLVFKHFFVCACAVADPIVRMPVLQSKPYALPALHVPEVLRKLRAPRGTNYSFQ